MTALISAAAADTHRIKPAARALPRAPIGERARSQENVRRLLAASGTVAPVVSAFQSSV